MRKKLWHLYQVILEYHQKCILEPKRAESLQQCMDKLIVILKICIVMYVAAFVSYLFYPVLVYFVVGEKITLIPIYLPYTNISESNFDYILNMVFQVILTFFGALAILVCDCKFLIYAVHTMGFADVFVIKMAELDDMVNKKTETEAIDAKDADIQKCIAESVVDHQQYME